MSGTSEFDPRKVLARDLMSRNVVTVSLDARLEDLATLLESHHISGVPVVEGEGRLVGVVSASDVLRLQARPHEEEEVPDYFRNTSSVYLAPLREEADPLRLGAMRVRDIFTTFVITASPEAHLPQLCALMARHHIHRILVVDESSLLGIVTSLDVVRWLATGHC